MYYSIELFYKYTYDLLIIHVTHVYIAPLDTQRSM
jgi:hypothetical protein